MLENIVTDSNGRRYKVFEGLAFHINTHPAVVVALLNAYKSRFYKSYLPHHQYRIRFYYGDTKTGRDWGEVYDIEGYIGRSTGSIKVPLVLYNSRSHGGPAILDHCIIKVEYANKKNGGVIYQHPLYHKDDEQYIIYYLLNTGERVFYCGQLGKRRTLKIAEAQTFDTLIEAQNKVNDLSGKWHIAKRNG